MQIGLPSGKVLVADFGGWEDDREVLKKRYFRLLEILAVKLPSYDVVKLMANGKFDLIQILHHLGIHIRNIRDVLIISQVLWAGVGVMSVGKGDNRSERCQIAHSLGGVCERLGLSIDKTEQTSNWGWELSNEQLNYGGKDAQILFPAFEKLKVLVAEAGCQYSAAVECQAVATFGLIEYLGSPVNVEAAEALKVDYESELEKTLEPYTAVFGEVNYKSPKEFLKALQERFPDRDIDSTGAEVIALIDQPETNAVLKARTIEKSIGFLDNVLAFAWRNRPQDHVSIRGFYHQLTPSGTGRSSCVDKVKRVKAGVSLQVTPGKIEGIDLPPVRSVVQAPPGYVMGIVDLSGSHARIAAELSQCKMLLKIYNDDLDGHSIYASFFSQLAAEEYVRLQALGQSSPESLLKIIAALDGKDLWTPEDIRKLKKKNEQANLLRDIAKTILYSSLNGGVKGTILRAFLSAGYTWFSENPQDDRLAEKAAGHFTELYPELVAFCRNTPKKANATKYKFKSFRKRRTKNNQNPDFLEEEYGIVKSLTGRFCYFAKKPGTREWNRDKLEVPYTDSISANWFLVESDVMKDWMYGAQKDLDAHPEYEAYVFNVVHDELDFIAKEEYAQEVATIFLWHQIRALKRWIKSIPVVENGPKFTDDSKRDWSIFSDWVETPVFMGEGKPEKAPWQQVLCQNYSEK